MKLRMKALAGVVKSTTDLDQMFGKQGFQRCHNQPPTYRAPLTDLCSGNVYRLSVPTKFSEVDEGLRLEEPILELKGENYPSASEHIPSEVLTAAHEKIEELASYLRHS
ncbi:hypothetical protein IC620_02580 [Hazenella sp. IB182357]|uniref:Uncharacterized protein n=1 Tax=Polycladospora coralii TaxID=2771432 RepID=A0A926N7Z4_9BACL|nr:hypothetical protein [Polycladospora coralii]MBD1371243.1 hypothetical protein [Polycladospora coralii]MBS7530185.1 hypothetical protein [Polycladospora coralii]